MHGAMADIPQITTPPARRWARRALLALGPAALAAALWLILVQFPATRDAAAVLAVAGAALAAAAAAAGFGGALLWDRAGGPTDPAEDPTVEVRTDLLEDQELLGDIIDSMEGSVMTISSGGTITSFNAIAERTLGYEAPAVVGRHYSTVFEDIPPNRAVRDMIDSALRANQTFSSVEVSAATASGRPVALGITISVLRGEVGRPRGIVLTFKNLAEIKRLREHVQRTDRLASLGRLAAGMAHEVRNPLGALHGLVELIEEDFSHEDPRRQYTRTILRTIDQLNTLVEHLLEFSQPPIAQLDRHDVTRIVDDAVQMCALEHKDRGVLLREHYGSEAIIIQADREALTRALVNVVRNAYQAAPSGGAVAVSVRSYPPEQPGRPEQVHIAVTNDGSHIRPEDREKLFTPFFTTKPDGTGLGLPIAHQIVTAHGGRIEVDSTPESGTTFTVLLPVETVGEQTALVAEREGHGL
jgi:PAS domain S-box-containing protein